MEGVNFSEILYDVDIFCWNSAAAKMVCKCKSAVCFCARKQPSVVCMAERDVVTIPPFLLY